MRAAIPHPRDVYDYDGGEVAERGFLDALESGRLHHAWLLVGPRGVGKATFAYRAARRLLGAPPTPELGLLGAAPTHPVSRQISGRAHPDLLVLQREQEDGKPRRDIPVGEARTLPDFFSKSPAAAPYRVAIIDAADDLNVNAANAVLKTLEEPPERGVLLLVSHAPGSLLPTLRSRCRRLRFDPPEPAAAVAWLTDKAQMQEADAVRTLDMARGAPGQAWRMAIEGALEADEAARGLLQSLPQPDEGALMAMAEGFRGVPGAARFELLFDRLAANVHALVTRRAAEGDTGPALDRWAGAWEMLITLPAEAAAVNLDKAEVFMTAVGRLRAIAALA